MNIQNLKTDFLVIGGGTAGTMAGINAVHPHGDRTTPANIRFL